MQASRTTKSAAVVAYCIAVGFISVATAIVSVDVLGLADVVGPGGVLVLAIVLAIGAGLAWHQVARKVSTPPRASRDDSAA